MFGSVGGPEVLLLFVLALLLFGPRRLPEIGRALGKTVAEFRRATTEFRSTLEREVEIEKLKDAGGALKSAGTETADAVKGPGLLGEIVAALRPVGASEPHGGTTDFPKREPAPPPPGAPPSPSVGPPTAAPVPFSDESDDLPKPDASPAEASPPHDVKREQA